MDDRQNRLRVGIIGYSLGLCLFVLGVHVLLLHGEIAWGIGMVGMGVYVAALTLNRIASFGCRPLPPRHRGPSEDVHEG